ncbi:MAG: hypothetical protein V4683_07780 [Bacteroidota bacterium]
MKILKGILFVVVFLVLAALLAAALMPKNYTVTVSETINKPKAEVYDYVKLFANQKEYSEWTKPDPNLVPEITGVDGTIGSKSYWKSTNPDVGEGSQTITGMSDDEIALDLEFISPMEGHGKVLNKFESKDSTTTLVTVTTEFDAPFPMNLPSILIGKPMIEKTEKQILVNIKQILEAKK